MPLNLLVSDPGAEQKVSLENPEPGVIDDRLTPQAWISRRHRRRSGLRHFGTFVANYLPSTM
jgi:hypothetical protein